MPVNSLSSVLSRSGTYLLATLVALLVVVGGCDARFEDVNSNPNEPEEVAPNLLLPNIIRSSVNTSVNTAHTTGNLVLQYAAKVQFAGDIDRYNWDDVGYWNAYYADLRNVDDLLRIAREDDRPSYRAVGLVMKSWIFSMLTNAYGDIPYSEAFKVRSEQEYTPAYDPQAEVYKGLLTDLRTANELIEPGSHSVQGDILYNGDLMKWKKLANSLRLRLLMRLSEKTGEIDGLDVTARFQEIVNNPGQHPVFTDNGDNAALEYLSSRPNQWPRHTSRLGTFRTYRMSKTLTDTLKAFDDPRLPVFADPTAASENAGDPKYVGVPNGLYDDESTNYNGGPSSQSTLNREKYYDQPDAAKGLIMTYAEVLFLKAEAAERGWTNGDAAQYYRDGIQASIQQYGQSVPSGYFNHPAVAYASNDTDRALEQIGTQKWIALFYTGLEGWFNWRRTGYPDINPSVRNQNNDQIPVRFRYPAREQSLNSENYQQAVERQGADDINTEMWLLE